MPEPTVVAWFSCGAASAVAARLAVDELSGTHEVRVVNTPVDEEDPDNRRFLRDVEAWLGVRIESATDPEWGTSAVAVWDRKRFMSGPKGAPCTTHIKKGARYEYERAFREEHGRPIDWHVLGFHAGERDRHEQFVLTERPNVLPLLIDAGLTKPACARIVLDAGIALPRVYTEKGYPNANCLGCVKATSPTYWNHVRREDPEVFAARAEQSREIGARLVRYRGERIYLDELPSYAMGRPMESLNFDCGLFCEEYRETPATCDA